MHQSLITSCNELLKISFITPISYMLIYNFITADQKFSILLENKYFVSQDKLPSYILLYRSL